MFPTPPSTLYLNPLCFRACAAEGGGLSGSLELSKAAQKELGPDVKRARMTIEEVSLGTLRVRITDAEHKRWEIPTHLFNSSVLKGGWVGQGLGRAWGSLCAVVPVEGLFLLACEGCPEALVFWTCRTTCRAALSQPSE